MIDYHEKYCKKCKYKSVSETEEPCCTCINDFFGNWKNPERGLTLTYFERGTKNGTDKDC